MSADVDPDYAEGSELTYLHGVAVTETTPVPDDLDAIEVPAGTWAVFRTEGPYPAALQSDVGRDGDRVVPVQPVAAPARTVDRRGPRPRRRLQHRDLRAVAARRTRVTAQPIRQQVRASVVQVTARQVGDDERVRIGKSSRCIICSPTRSSP